MRLIGKGSNRSVPKRQICQLRRGKLRVLPGSRRAKRENYSVFWHSCFNQVARNAMFRAIPLNPDLLTPLSPNASSQYPIPNTHSTHKWGSAASPRASPQNLLAARTA